MSCEVMRIGEATVFRCSDMWDDPRSVGLADYMNAKAEEERREYEREQDVARELELCPPTEAVEPEVIPAELVMDWTAYGEWK